MQRLCSKGFWDSCYHRNVIHSRSHQQTSQILGLTSPALLSTSSFSQPLLELSKVLADTDRAFSGDPKTSCRYGGAFRMLQDTISWIVKFWSSWDLIAGLWETSRATETSGWLCGSIHAVFSQQSFIGFHNHKAFHLSYLSLLQSPDSLHHNMICTIYHSLSLYIHTVNLAADGILV